MLGDPQKAHAIRFAALRWSPDGKRLACGDGPELQIWDANSGDLQFHHEAHAGGIWRLAWSADGKTLFSGGLSDQDVQVVKTWDASGGKLLKTTDGVGCSLSRDGKTVALFGAASIRLFDLESRTPLGVIVVMPVPGALALSPDGHFRGSSGIEDEIVYVIQTDKGQQTLTPAEFAARYHWTNDPSKVGKAGK